ncbi:hypothetical protein Calab_1023 [Caldithrix abyssi DSM 13497]|uniref:SIR2-like domain-containing protein n=1 Tax=Caldithrix abyssi DSM 13497 TaxID=880073 RepID=H1XVT0_CALAY|nr:hypothetical protein [Caldithrix abyssi]APF20878.1 hypothetical protein Cabys_4133 [Caldithrix abyssi DSM 13497]EHO40657.1 hypothetical protein Calab_1023 [Caldithrix abyssi DSM 13497]
MHVDNVKQIKKDHIKNIAFVVGNGINRYGLIEGNSSWDQLLLELWRKVIGEYKSDVPLGISLTEFYDILELNNTNNGSTINLQKEFCNLMNKWSFQKHHVNFIKFAMRFNTPVLTTNFDNTFQKAGRLNLYRTSTGGFTDFYPWESYYSLSRLNYPTDGFGVWHINGMQKYFRSIRLGLTHYMGSVERARRMIHKGNEERLFAGKNVHNWPGAKTWLHIVFNKSLFIFGLGLEENEVFLRWLLIERAKYFNKFKKRRMQGWYIAKNGSTSRGKKLFLNQIGIKVIELSNYKDIYENLWN